jgi:hypothetical protein
MSAGGVVSSGGDRPLRPMQSQSRDFGDTPRRERSPSRERRREERAGLGEGRTMGKVTMKFPAKPAARVAE